MPLRWSAVLLLLASLGARADVLYFEPTTGPDGINYSWFSIDNWYYELTPEAVPANRLPEASDTVVLPFDTLVVIGPNTVQVNTLDASLGYSFIQGGDITAITIDTLSATFTNSTIHVDNGAQWNSSGDTLESCTADIESGGLLFVDDATLFAEYSSTLYVVGQIELMNNSVLNFSTGTNLLSIRPDAEVTGVGNNKLMCAGALIIDNNGVIQSDDGTLSLYSSGVFWTNSVGVGRFTTVTTNAVLEFPQTFAVQPGDTNLITGPGLTLFQASAIVIDGVLEIGATNPSPGTVDLAAQNSSISGTGTVDVIGTAGLPSTLIWEYGTLAGPTINIDANSELILTNAIKLITNSVVNNSGTTVWLSDHADLQMENGAVFNNLPGALFNAQNGANIASEGGANPSFFNNSGTFRKSVSTKSTLFHQDVPPSPSLLLVNSGWVDVETGTLGLEWGTNSGRFNVAQGATLQFVGGTNVQTSTATYTGPGLFEVSDGADFWVADDLSISNLQVDSTGSVDGPGDLTIDGLLAATDANLRSGGSLIINTNAAAIVSGTASMLARNVSNWGMVGVTNSGFTASQGVSWTDQPGGVLDLDGAALSSSPTGAPPVLLNAGTLVNEPVSRSTISWAITNSGTITVNANSLTLQAPATQISGVIQIASGATLEGNATPLIIQGGTIEGQGQAALFSTPIVNSGTIHPGDSPGILTISGALTNTPGAILAIDIGGTIAGTQYSQLNSGSGQVWLNNLVLNLTFDSGFVPSVGQSFVIWNNANINGAFSSLGGNHPAPGIVMVPVYSASSVTLVAATNPVLSLPMWQSAASAFTIPTTPGITSVVQYTIALAPANWQVLTNVVGDGLVHTITDHSATNATRFYRVLLK